MAERGARSGGVLKTVSPRVVEPAKETLTLQDAADLLLALQRELLEDGPPACIVDVAGQRIYANKGYRRIADALSTQSTLAALPPLCENMLAAEIQEHKLTIDDRTEYYRARSWPLRDADGRVRATIRIYESITRLKATAAALVQASARLDDITRLVSDWVWETDRSLVFTFVSPRVQDALGYHPREVIGRSLYDLPVDRAPTLLSLTAGERHPPFRDIEIEVMSRKGERLLFRLSGLPVYCGNSGSFQGYRGTAEDITSLRRREEALIKAKESAELANRSKTEVLTNMSHELRTPLTAIIGFSEIMENELFGALGNRRYQSYASDIRESAQHLRTLINDILDVAKIEAGAHELHEEQVDPADVVGAVERLVAERAKRAGLALSVSLPDSLPYLKGDGRKLKQVLLNLMSNGIKFTPEGGHIGLTAWHEADGGFIFEVSDTGIGIEPKDIPRVFAPFEQVDSHLSRQYEGTGLGLPLSDGFVKLHGGRLTLESELGKGTKAIVRLPPERVISREDHCTASKR